MALHRWALAAIALAVGCDYSVWLSDDRDAGAELDAPLDARLPDAGPPDTGGIDAGPIDAGPPRACRTTPSVLGAVRTTGPLEQPTFAVSGRLTSLRYGVLVPPSASTIATPDTTLLVADRDGNVVAERRIRIEGAGGVPASTATLHALSHESTAEGFVVLGPRAIWILDADAAGDPIALATPPRSEWQRAAGWIDADRFVFVTDTADLRLAVLDRAAGAVSTTPISVAGAGSVHVEPSGVTVSVPGPGETIVYAPDLSGTELLRTGWDDGDPLGARLLAAAMVAGQRTWIIRGTNEFRTDVASWRVTATGEAVRSTGITLVSPVTGSLEGPVIALEGSGPTRTFYSLALDSFTEPAAAPGSALVEWEREAEHVALLTLVPDATGGLSLELACGLR